MANRSFAQFSYSLEKAPVTLFGDVTIGATGAPTLVTANSKGIASISRTSAGLYVLTLQDAYQRLMGFDIMTVPASATGIPTATSVAIKSSAVNTAGGGTITFQLTAPTNSSTTTLVATDPANGDELLIHIVLSNTTAI